MWTMAAPPMSPRTSTASVLCRNCHQRAGSGVVITVALLLLVNVAALCAENAAPPADRKARIVLVGDSTVTDKAGWGLGFKRFLTDRAECINTAAGGRSSKSFINKGREGAGPRAQGRLLPDPIRPQRRAGK